jgi:LmbE family N-acetylglucosaminyl deacetylase
MGPDGLPSSSRVVLIAAHPDDEVVGAGGQFPELRDRLTIVLVTDGAPASGHDAQRSGFTSNTDYAAARFTESITAAALAGVAPEQFVQLRIGDQRASYALRGLAQRIAAVLEETKAGLVLTNPYEGGHPDHDATAWAVHAAAALLARAGHAAPVVWEYASYHRGPNGIETGRFLPGGPREIVKALSPERHRLKQQMIECFATQRDVLSHFKVEDERFRPSPGYDFTAAPHPGRAYYDDFDWGIASEHFRALAAEANRELELYPQHVTHDS